MGNKPGAYNNIKLKLILIALFIIGSIIIIFFQVTIFVPEKIEKIDKLNENYFDSFNDSFSGIIVSKNTTRQSAGYGKLLLLKLRLTSSTINHYDLRDSLEYSFCVIDTPYAEILFYRKYFDWIQIGDSCSFNGTTDSLCIYKHTQDGTYYICNKPNIINPNISYLEKFFTIKKRKVKRNSGDESPNYYYMLLFGKFKKKEKLIESYKKFSSNKKYKKIEIPKYFEKRNDAYYFFINDKRYDSYNEAYIAWKEAGFNELYIVKFDKHNNFKEILKKEKKGK